MILPEKTILDFRKIDIFKLSIRKVPKNIRLSVLGGLFG